MSAPTSGPRSVTGGGLETALDRLVARGTLDRAQADAVLAELATAAHGGTGLPGPAGSADRSIAEPTAGSAREGRAWTTVLAEVGGYIGAAFVLAAVLVFTGPRWDELSHNAKLATLAVPALLMLVAAAALAQAAPGRWTPYPRTGLGPRRRLVSALVLVGGGLLGGVTAVQLPDRFASYSSERQGTWVALTLLAVWALGYLACRSALLHLGAAVAACVAAGTAASWLARDSDGVAAGTALVAVAVVWAGLTLARLLHEREVGYAVAGVIAFVGGEVLANQANRSWGGYLVLAVLAVAGLTGYVATRMISVLVVGVVALGTVVPQSIIDYTDGAFGAAGALLVTGLSIVGASVLGLRLRREVPGRHG
jgi:hypothetical protein